MALIGLNATLFRVEKNIFAVESRDSSLESLVPHWLFVVMISDLDTPVDMWKYVDDTSCSEIVTKGNKSKLQEAVDHLSRQASLDGFQLNGAKCKEL